MEVMIREVSLCIEHAQNLSRGRGSNSSPVFHGERSYCHTLEEFFCIVIWKEIMRQGVVETNRKQLVN